MSYCLKIKYAAERFEFTIYPNVKQFGFDMSHERKRIRRKKRRAAKRKLRIKKSRGRK